ncbi:MAG: histidine decarboxylase [Methylococcaceae bacterium]|nr:histidine decarboxylase [Methylococcaceae bacterium]
MSLTKKIHCDKRLTSQLQQRLQNFLSFVDQEADRFLGYPCNRFFDYTPLYPFLSFPLNNVGDPFLPSRYHLNSHEFEREVIGFFSALTHAKPEEIWGYVTNGGTEGNMYGIYLAREIYPEGMVYYSEATHYSVPKILRMVHARNIMIKSTVNGEIDYQDLAETLRIHRDVPAIIFANIGTTMTGAVDNLDRIKQILKDNAITHHYIHCDAALGGMILPFVEHPPAFDFNAGIDSLAISGHKMIGSPIPCGIALAKKCHVDRIARAVEYISTFDTTVSGSRNAITPLFLWYAIHSQGIQGFRKIVRGCLEMAAYAVQRFNECGIPAWRNENSITVVFPKGPDAIMNQWQIALQGDMGHILVMPHVTKNQINLLLADITAAKEVKP